MPQKVTKEIIIQKIEENRAKIRSFGVKKLTLFGSYASGEAKKNSDIDFLVEFKRNRGLYDDYMGLLLLLQNTFKKEIDLVKPKLIRKELKEDILGGKKIAAQI